MNAWLTSENTAFQERQPRSGAVLPFGNPPGFMATAAAAAITAVNILNKIMWERCNEEMLLARIRMGETGEVIGR